MKRAPRIVPAFMIATDRYEAESAAGYAVHFVTVMGNVALVRVTTNLTGTIYYHWYVDGVWQGATTTPEFSAYLDNAEQANVYCLPTKVPDFDGRSLAMASYVGRRTLEWLRPIDTTVASYTIQYGTGVSLPSDWTTIGTVRHDGRWAYQFTTPIMADVTYVWFRVLAVDVRGNSSAALTLGPDFVVRIPNVPRYSAAFSNTTQKVTLSAA